MCLFTSACSPLRLSPRLPVRADRWARPTSPPRLPAWYFLAYSIDLPSHPAAAADATSDGVPSPASPPPYHLLPRPPLLPRTHSWPQRLLDLAAAQGRAGGVAAGSRRPARQGRREASGEARWAARASGRPRSGAGARPTVHRSTEPLWRRTAGALNLRPPCGQQTPARVARRERRWNKTRSAAAAASISISAHAPLQLPRRPQQQVHAIRALWKYFLKGNYPQPVIMRIIMETLQE